MTGTYPEHEKQAAVAVESEAVRDFLEWLFGQGYVIAEYEGDRLYSVHRSPESWTAQRFQINPVQIERERRAMLDGMRALHDDERETA